MTVSDAVCMKLCVTAFVWLSVLSLHSGLFCKKDLDIYGSTRGNKGNNQTHTRSELDTLGHRAAPLDQMGVRGFLLGGTSVAATTEWQSAALALNNTDSFLQSSILLL